MKKGLERHLSGLLFLLMIVSIAFLPSCSSSQQEMDATRTQVAADLFGTQTSLAPTATITLTPTITMTAVPSATPIPTRAPTNTPLPTVPTPTKNAEGVERMQKCYKAAVTVYADLKALYMDDAWLSEYRKVDEKALSALQAERKGRYNALVQYVETCFLPGTEFEVCSDKAVLSVDGITLNGDDCLGYDARINSCNNFLQVMRITGGVGMTPHQSANMQCGDLGEGVQIIKEALLNTYGVDPAELDAMVDPIWQNVHNRYGVAIPGGN